jgi:hypothetical protein
MASNELSPQTFDRAIAFVRANQCSWEDAVRLARYSKMDPPPVEERDARERDDRDDRYDDEDRNRDPARTRTKPLRLEDDQDDDDRVPEPRQLKEPQVVRRRSGHDDEDDEEDRRKIDAALAKVARGKCVSCGRKPAGSAWLKNADASEEESLDGKHEEKQTRSYLVPMCPSCKQEADADEVGETEVVKRHAKARGDCNRFNHSALLAARRREQ